MYRRGKYCTGPMETFMKVIETEISIRNMKLSGAACDYTEPSPGKNFISFPVQDL